jgi:hypothetical protein
MSRQEISTILASLDSRDVKQLDASYPVWAVSEPGLLSLAGRVRRQAINTAKLKILRAVLDGPSPVFVMHPDDPAENAVTSGCHRIAPQTYRLDPSFDPATRSADYWLFSLGHWVLFAASAPIATEWPDPLPSAPHALLRWMQSVEMAALITSSADDTDWVVALARNSTS